MCDPKNLLFPLRIQCKHHLCLQIKYFMQKPLGIHFQTQNSILNELFTRCSNRPGLDIFVSSSDACTADLPAGLPHFHCLGQSGSVGCFLLGLQRIFFFCFPFLRSSSSYSPAPSVGNCSSTAFRLTNLLNQRKILCFWLIYIFGSQQLQVKFGTFLIKLQTCRKPQFFLFHQQTYKTKQKQHGPELN